MPALLRVVSAGGGGSVQDAGRPGWRRFGVPAGGWMDPAAAALANRLMDNPPGAPVLELHRGGARLTVLADTALAFAGADGPASVALGRAHRVRAGQEVSFGAFRAGQWLCVAAPGGWEAPLRFGGRGALPVANLGVVLRPGLELHAAGREPGWPAAVAARIPAAPVPPDDGSPLRVWPAAQTAAFAPAERARFFQRDWTLSRQCDRVGYRLDGPPLAVPAGEPASEPQPVGTVQVARDGRPIVLMRDGPAVGGYPKLGVLDPDDLPRLARRAPGTAVRFAPSPDFPLGV